MESKGRTVSGQAEWLEADGLGGYASGTVRGPRTRRYHALLLSAATPPTGRVVLVNGFDAWVTTRAGTFALTSQAYLPDVLHPDGARRVASFDPEPWPRWTFRLEDGTVVEQEIFVPKGRPAVAVSWRLLVLASDWASPGDLDRTGERDRARVDHLGELDRAAETADTGSATRRFDPREPLGAPAGVTARLAVRPFFSGRDHHVLHHENAGFRFDPETKDGCRIWRPYDGLPGVRVETNGEYEHEPVWYRSFAYSEERLRGLDFTEDLASPGTFHFDLMRGEAVWILEADGSPSTLAADLIGDSRARNRTVEPQPAGASLSARTLSQPAAGDSWSVGSQTAAGTEHKLPAPISATAPDRAAALLERLRDVERHRRSLLGTPLARGADAYLVLRGRGLSILAGYPWFTDWGRDTFIALRGLCLALGRLEAARMILMEWAGTVSEGMMPNRFPDSRSEPEYNSVDASLWFIVAVHEYLNASAAAGEHMNVETLATLLSAMDAILGAYTRGTRHGIHADADGLLAAGAPGIQLTWMDAATNGGPVTARTGKPVEIQALWLNALKIASGRSSRWATLFERGHASFQARFWSEQGGYLFDVIDVDHSPGAIDATFGPNQILAVGGLPFSLLEGERARRVVDEVEKRLLTPLGLRTLARGEPGYAPRYEGDPRQRDESYHRGTVWPWLMGPFVEAWVRVHGGSRGARREARERFLDPLLSNLDRAGIGHLPEIADAEPPHTPRGCPFQAWSVGEALRLDRVVLAP